MTRYLCWVAVLGVLTLPDWASACWPHWAARHSYYAEPVYYAPSYSYPVYPAYPLYAPPVCVCPPVAIQPIVQPMAPPRITPSSNMGTATPREVPTTQVQPAGATDTATMTPSPMPMVPAIPMTPVTVTPPLKKADPVTVTPIPKNTEPVAKTPDVLPKFPTVSIPEDIGPLPKLEVPKEPNFQPILVPKNTPKTAVPTPAPAPAVVRPDPTPAGMAVPMAAPAFPEGLIPSPSVPVLPDASRPLPPLTLSPEVPVQPKGSVSRSSPVSDKSEMTVSVFPVAGRGEHLANGYCVVGFYNHTSRDMNLTIEGRVVKLPAKMYLHAKLAPTFTWSHGDNSGVRESVPDGASGVDVVFRD